MAFVITSKYCDHLPLHRQESIIARLGVEIPRSTLCGWMAACADLLRPLYDAMLADVLRSRVVQTDETRLPVLEKGNDKTKSGRLWAFVGDRDHPHTIYHYTATKARDGPAGVLENYQGFLQADAANVFDGLYHPGAIVEVGCWAHGRRYFHDARTSDAARAAEALARISFFYDVEREAKKIVEEQELDGAQADALRLKMRQERTLPKLHEFADWLDAQASFVLPKSPIALAINYVRNHWAALLRFTEHGFLNIDNNASERAMRPAALGRKNFLFAGSDEGGPHHGRALHADANLPPPRHRPFRLPPGCADSSAQGRLPRTGRPVPPSLGCGSESQSERVHLTLSPPNGPNRGSPRKTMRFTERIRCVCVRNRLWSSLRR